MCDDLNFDYNFLSGFQNIDKNNLAPLERQRSSIRMENIDYITLFLFVCTGVGVGGLGGLLGPPIPLFHDGRIVSEEIPAVSTPSRL